MRHRQEVLLYKCWRKQSKITIRFILFGTCTPNFPRGCSALTAVFRAAILKPSECKSKLCQASCG